MTENIHKHRILILDFGSQYTQLVARRVRELGVYCELWAWDVTEAQIRDFNPSGIILSGGPDSTTEENSPRAPQYVFEAGVPVFGEDLRQELVTPTGAALVRELAAGFGPLPPMRLESTGYGAGTRERSDGRPNLLRLLLGESLEAAEAQRVEVLETHLDDWNPEFWPYLSGRLMAAGALDVCLIPMHMKKGRPGFLLRVLAAHERSLAEAMPPR